MRAMQLTKERLTVNTPVGGIARYEGDQYFRAVQDVPGNPGLLPLYGLLSMRSHWQRMIMTLILCVLI